MYPIYPKPTPQAQSQALMGQSPRSLGHVYWGWGQGEWGTRTAREGQDTLAEWAWTASARGYPRLRGGCDPSHSSTAVVSWGIRRDRAPKGGWEFESPQEGEGRPQKGPGRGAQT